MSDDLERRLRDSLRSAALPRAPETLADYLVNLPQRGALPTTSWRLAQRRPVLVGAAVFLLALLVVGTFLFAGATTRPAPTLAPNQPAGFRHFEAPGIAFDYPASWINQSVTGYPTPLGARYVGLLARGLPRCPYATAATPSPSPGSSPTCQDGVRDPGSLILWVAQITNPLPGSPSPTTSITVAGRPASFSKFPTERRWTIFAADGSLYTLDASFPSQDEGARQSELDALIAGVVLSDWKPSPPVVNGRIHLELLPGVSFDYPAGWAMYYSGDASTMDSGLVIVSSRPLLACESASCQRYMVPPGAIAIEFRVGGGPSAPNWSTAKETVGGEPAFRQDFTIPTADMDEGHSWSVRLAVSRRRVLGIYASLRGPDLPTLRQQLDDVLNSVRIPVPALPSGPPDVVASDAVQAAIATMRHSYLGQPAEEFFGCFPDGPGSRQGTISVGPGGLTLGGRHVAICTASVTASDNGLWQLDLIASWSDSSSGTVGERLWLDQDGAIVDQMVIPRR
jgi:hypothetical protein